MRLSRGKKLAYNMFSATLYQCVSIICGFILPRLILGKYGSEVNGLVISILQFLGVINLLDFGIGGVARSNLYKPLAENDYDSISKIYVSAARFFRKIAYIFLAYVFILMALYPVIVNDKFGYGFTVTLIGSIFISSFVQYYFGIVNNILLTADQKEYILNAIYIITMILNTVACAIMIEIGASIQIVKLVTSLVYILRPLYLMNYVKKNYKINTKITFTEEPIKQKWNGMAVHFSFYILESTDNIVLTLFSTLANVSIYSVYNMVINGVKNLFFFMSKGFTSLMGDMLAKKENEMLNAFFSYVEWFYHTGTVLIFGCTSILLVPFVRVYTNGVNDANYVQPLFCILITLANAIHTLRSPYNMAIQAAGHYKQTQNNHIIATTLNIIISIATVKIWGLIGVSIGTLVAMTYQTIWMAWYNSRSIIKRPINLFIKQGAIDVFTVLIASAATLKIPMLSVSYRSWIIQAIEVFACWFVIVVVNYIFYKEMVVSIITRIRNTITHTA